MYSFHTVDISSLADWCSIVGVIIALGTLLFALIIEGEVSSLTRKVLFNTRMISLKNNLDASSSKISKLLKDFAPNSKMILKEISICKGCIEGMINKLPTKEKVEAKRLKKQLNKYSKSKLVTEKTNRCFLIRWYYKTEILEDECWETYTDLMYFSKLIDNLIEDKKIL